MVVVLWCHAIPQRQREKAGGGVCDKWFMYVHYLGTVILIIKANETHYFSNIFWSRTLHVLDRSTVTS